MILIDIMTEYDRRISIKRGYTNDDIDNGIDQIRDIRQATLTTGRLGITICRRRT